MEEVFHALLAGRRDEIPPLVRRWQEDFRAHRVSVRQFMKTETLQDSLAAYQEKVKAGTRNPSAPYELALRAARPYQPGDQISYYVAGATRRGKVNESAKLATAWSQEAPDENTVHYLAKLWELYEKFRPLIERDGLVPATDEPDGPRQGTLFPELEGAPTPEE
jgi:DNA polymerase elongation subunit (family B)